MSLPLNLLPSIPYVTTPYGQPIDLCTPISKDKGPRVLRVDVDWTNPPYNASYNNRNVSIVFSLDGQRQNNALDAIRFVKIDNSFNDTPVYLQFSDSNDAIPCPANAVVGVPVMSRGQNFVLYGTGFFTGRAPITSVFLSNAPQDAYFIQDAGRYFVTGGLTDAGFNNNNLTSYTFNNLRAGPPFTGRGLLLCVGGSRAAGTAFPVNSVTCEGQAMTLRVSDQVSGRFVAIYTHRFDTLDEVDVVINCGAVTLNYCAVSLYAIAGYNSLVPLSISDDDNTTNSFVVSGLTGIPGSFSVFCAERTSAVGINGPLVYGTAEIDAWFSDGDAYASYHAKSELAEISNCATNMDLLVGASFA